MLRTIVIILIILAFLAGLYVYSTQKLDIQLHVTRPNAPSPIVAQSPSPSPAAIKNIKENLQSMTEKTAKCPNILVKSGEVLLLYNTTDTHDEMPVIFKNLEEYANYIRVQKQNGIRCPILFLEQENNVQGQDVFRIKSTPFNDYYTEPFAGLVGSVIEAPSSGSKLSFPPSAVAKIPGNSPAAYPFYNIEAFDGGLGSPSAVSPAPAPAPTPTMPSSNTPPANGGQPVQQQQPPQQQPQFESPYNKGGYPGFDPYGFTIGKYTDLDKIHDSTATSAPISDNPMDPNWGGTQFTRDAVDSGKYIENSVYSVNYSMPGGVQFYPGLHKTYPDPPNYVKQVGGPVPPYLQ